MAPVRLPRYDAADTVALSRVHQALVEEDQHDDWLPDPVHYRDRRQRADASIAAIERLETAPVIRTLKRAATVSG